MLFVLKIVTVTKHVGAPITVGGKEGGVFFDIVRRRLFFGLNYFCIDGGFWYHFSSVNRWRFPPTFCGFV